MRTITSHTVEGDAANHQLKIDVLDEPGAGGANHAYEISWEPKPVPPQPGFRQEFIAKKRIPIWFQNGPILEASVNGVTQEALAAIIIDRLESFQSGPFACEENQIALEHFKAGLAALQDRTKKRMARGVEGTHKP